MPRRADIELYEGDCLAVLRGLASGSVELAYLDPPFFTQKVHRLVPRDRSAEFSFDDLWTSQREYCRFLFERLGEVHRVLSNRGAVFFHCDHNAVHLARLLLDDVFGATRFRSEIIWHYRRWSNSQRGLLPAHQTILYYTKSDEFVFNEMRTEYSPATNVDQILQRRSRDAFNKSTYDRDGQGNVIHNGAKRGVPLSDVWDIPLLNPKARERTGYPTQKPLQLLERIIALSTDDGACVLDPFCGSGTTLVAARMLGRSAIGIDNSRDAIEIARRRLRDPVRSHSRLLEVGRSAYRNADEAALAMLQGLEIVPVQRNSGIDALLKQEFDGGAVPVRVQRPGESLLDVAEKLMRATAGKGAKLMFVVALERGACFEFADALPPEVVVVESPALAIQEYMTRMTANRLAGRGRARRGRKRAVQAPRT